MPLQANSTAIANAIVNILAAMPLTMLTACNQAISSGVQTITPQSMNGITANMQLQCDVSNPEIVTVSSVTASTFTATFALSHLPTWTIGTGGNLLNLTKLGEVQDPTDVVPFASVTGLSRKTERFSSGWKVNSKPVFQIESGADLGIPTAPVSSSAAEALLFNIADTLIGYFVAHIALGGVPGVYVTLVDMDDRWGYKQYFNGRIYRVHRCFVHAVQQYNVLVSQ